jgi:uncharacterized integral membrane protein
VAEIPIQRKERRTAWPVLIGAIILLAVMWYVFARNSVQPTVVRADSTAVATPKPAP